MAGGRPIGPCPAARPARLRTAAFTCWPPCIEDTGGFLQLQAVPEQGHLVVCVFRH